MTNQTNKLEAAAKKRAPGRCMARPPEGIETPAAPDAAPARRSNKTTAVVALVSRPDGATLAELITVTGWLPHTTRAALTGLRKKGYDVQRFKRDNATCYRIGGAQ